MITPSPTDKLQPTQARGTLAQIVEATALKPGYLVLAVPNTSYELHLQPVGGVGAPSVRVVGEFPLGSVPHTA
mgnify:CR=1 FL=1